MIKVVNYDLEKAFRRLLHGYTNVVCGGNHQFSNWADGNSLFTLYYITFGFE
jgi:hypothetical protein